MFKIYKGKKLLLIVVGLFVFWWLVQWASFADALKSAQEKMDLKMKMKAIKLDNVYFQALENARYTALAPAYKSAQQVIDSYPWSCEMNIDDVLSIVMWTPQWSFLINEAMWMGEEIDKYFAQSSKACKHWIGCIYKNEPKPELDPILTLKCKQDVAQRFFEAYNNFKFDYIQRAHLKRNNVFADGDLSNAPWDLLVDIKEVSDVLFKEPKDPPKVVFEQKAQSSPPSSQWECPLDLDLVGMISFKLCWVESKAPEFQNWGDMPSIEQIMGEYLAMLQKAKSEWSLMEHTKTDEWWETSLQGIELKDLFTVNFTVQVKPLLEHKTKEQKEEERQKQNNDFKVDIIGDRSLMTQEGKNKYNVLAPSTLKLVDFLPTPSPSEAKFNLQPIDIWLQNNIIMWEQLIGLFDSFRQYSKFFYNKLQSR